MPTLKEYRDRNAAREKQRAEKKRLWWFQEPQAIDRFTGWLAIFTALLFIATVVSAAILWKTDNTLHRTLIETERPWLSAELSPGSDFIFSPANDLNGATFSLHVAVKNIGKTPAINAEVKVALHVETASNQSVSDDWRKACTPLLKGTGLGYVIFPNDTVETSVPMFLPASAISDAVEDRWQMQKKFRGASDEKKVIIPIAVGCILYNFPFAPADEYHQTQINAWVLSKTTDAIGVPTDKGNISKSQLTLLRQRDVGNGAY